MTKVMTLGAESSSCMFPPSSPPVGSISQYSVSIQTRRRFCHAPRRPRGSVRFQPRSGHAHRRHQCLLSAKSRHWVAGKVEDLGFCFRLPHHLLRDLLGGNPLRKRNERLAAPTRSRGGRVTLPRFTSCHGMTGYLFFQSSRLLLPRLSD